MSKVGKITEEYFNDVKRSLNRTWKWTRFTKRHINDVAYKHGISLKTVMQIKNSATWQDYQDLNKSQHPEIQYSLRDHVLELHKLMYDKGDNQYVSPLTAKTAITQMIYDEKK